jgi:hypothetical protein
VSPTRPDRYCNAGANAGRKQQLWYEACLALLERRLPGNALVKELREGMAQLWTAVS